MRRAENVWQTKQQGNNSTPDEGVAKPDNLKSTAWCFGFWSVGGNMVHKSTAVCKLLDAELAYHSTTVQSEAAFSECAPAERNKVGEEEREKPLSKQAKLTAFSSLTAS